MKKPNFFIVGAPKCGTTSLANWLSSCDEIFMSDPKEPRFFNTDHLEIGRLTLAEYEALFAGAGEATAIGEASAWYLYSAAAVPNILAYNPDARFIVLVRNPLTMVFSMHNQAVFAGIEPLLDFRQAWSAQAARKEGRNVPAKVDKAHLLYGDICKLGQQVERLIHLAGRDKVHIAFLDDIQADPSRAFRSVLQFLHVRECADPDFTAANEAQARRLPWLRQLTRGLGVAKAAIGIRRDLGLLDFLDRWNRRPRRYHVDDGMIAELRSYFRQDIELLGRITGRDLTHWLSDPLDRSANPPS